jgi:hypothetical protein
MSQVSMPVNRPAGRALVVGSATHRASPMQILQRHYGFDCAEADDPYAAMFELARRRLVYHMLILSLASLYREELALIPTVKRRFPHLEIWLAHTDGRQALLAEAMRLGADGLLADDGLHRMAPAVPSGASQTIGADSNAAPSTLSSGEQQKDMPEPRAIEPPPGEPVLTAEELRALLQDQPAMPPSGAPEST